MILLAVAAAMVPPAMVWLGKRLADLITLDATSNVSLGEAMPTVIALGVLATAQRVFGILENTRQVTFNWRLEHEVSRRFFRQAAIVDLGHFDNSDWHDRVARAKRDVNWRPAQLVRTVTMLAASLVTTIGMLGILVALHPILVLLALGAVIPTLVAQKRVNKRLYDFYWVTTPEDREKQYIGELLSLPRSAKEIRSFALTQHFLTRHRSIDAMQFARLHQLYKVAERYSIVSAVVSGLLLAAAYGFVASRGLAGDPNLTAGGLLAVTGAFASVAGQIGVISGSIIQLDQHATFLEDYFSFMAIEPLIPLPEKPVPLPKKLDDGIGFNDVHFTYPGGTEPALAGLDLHIRPGELMALVGDNGAGKTSLVKLLLRFYDPTAGSITIGGVDLRDADPADVRDRIGILFQDFANYELSARENVTLGRVTREATDEAIHAALEHARADGVVKKLANGIDSKVGRLFEGGHDLSGGEWQRLALARLLYRDADIWILDEPTAALDPEAEAAIFAQLREQLHGRMGIVISHRFSTVRIADRIAVVNDGRVQELGTHQELLALGGRYAQLFELQAAGYR